MPDRAVLVETADAVTAAINAAEFTDVVFTAERSYADWDEQLEDSDCLKVDVVPVGISETELDGRDSVAYRVQIDIGVRKKFVQKHTDASGRLKQEEIDTLVLLVQEIHELFCSEATRRLSDYDKATWSEASIRVAYNRQTLREWRQFYGLIRVTYDVHRELA